LAKAFADRGIDPNKVKILTTGEMVDEKPLESMGNSALGMISGWHYDIHPDFFAVGGYDGMHLIYEALKKTNGNTDGEKLIAAAKGMSWESPRGMVKI